MSTELHRTLIAMILIAIALSPYWFCRGAFGANAHETGIILVDDLDVQSEPVTAAGEERIGGLAGTAEVHLLKTMVQLSELLRERVAVAVVEVVGIEMAGRELFVEDALLKSERERVAEGEIERARIRGRRLLLGGVRRRRCDQRDQKCQGQRVEHRT